MLVAFTIMVCDPEDKTPVVNDQDVVPVASENGPESTDTSIFCIPDGSVAVPVTVIEPIPRIAPLEGDVIVTIGGAARTVCDRSIENIVATSIVIDKNVKILFIVSFHLKF